MAAKTRVTLKMDGKLKSKDAQLFVAWIEHALMTASLSDVTVQLQLEDKCSILVLEGQEDAQLERALEVVRQTMQRN